METIKIRNRTEDFTSYRAARVKSLFNAETGSQFNFDVDVDLSGDWTIGVVVGPSGSGKTSIGNVILNGCGITDLYEGWDNTKPIVDCIAPGGDFNDVTGALANVGLGDVPAWLRNFGALSNGQKFRAGLARLMIEKPEQAIIDEYSSVVDRQVAVIGSKALQKAWRRGNKGERKLVLLTPHYDVLDWLQPDWVLDTKDYKFHRGDPRQSPRIELEIITTNQACWKYFKPHYYLDLPEPPAAQHFVGLVDGELACHVVVAPMFNSNHYRMTRLVTMPEWQGGRGRDGVSELGCRVPPARARAKIQEAAAGIPHEPPAVDPSHAALAALGANLCADVLAAIKEKELLGIRERGNLRRKPASDPRFPIRRRGTGAKNRTGGMT